MKKFFILPLLMINNVWALSEAESALNKPELLKEIRVEKGGVAQLTQVAQKHHAKGDLVLQFYCVKDSSKCELQQVQVTERSLGKK